MSKLSHIHILLSHYQIVGPSWILPLGKLNCEFVYKNYYILETSLQCAHLRYHLKSLVLRNIVKLESHLYSLFGSKVMIIFRH